MGKQTELTKITSLVHGCDRPSMVASDTRRRMAALFPLTTQIPRDTPGPAGDLARLLTARNLT